jgi:hypothetical protein
MTYLMKAVVELHNAIRAGIPSFFKSLGQVEAWHRSQARELVVSLARHGKLHQYAITTQLINVHRWASRGNWSQYTIAHQAT